VGWHGLRGGKELEGDKGAKEWRAGQKMYCYFVKRADRETDRDKREFKERKNPIAYVINLKSDNLCESISC
jgi:hypothetical protein